jgi:spore coat polysaccharide biosynthesis predicted glycosyltransferase SpsG
MKKLCIIGEITQPVFWQQHLNLSNVNLTISNNPTLNIIDEKPDLVILDEYFHENKYKNLTKELIKNGIDYYIFTSDEDVSNKKYNMDKNILNKINKILLE